MSSGIPPVTVSPRRFKDPNGVFIEPIAQPLYSTVGVAGGVVSLPQELNFFGYGIGQLVPGTGNGAGFAATLFHTNLEMPNQLAKPKRFTCIGARLHMPNIAFTATVNTPEVTDAGFGAALTDSDPFEDLLSVVYSGHLRFRVGEKYYIDQPAFNVPGNVGFAGVASISSDNGTAATATSLDVQLLHSVGQGIRFPVYPVLIDDQQSFTATLIFQWPVPPVINDARIIVMILDGKLSREVQ